MWYDIEENIAIFGGTQQGKTVLANEVYANSKRIGVFWNPDGEDYVKGWKVKSFDDILTGMQRGYKKFSFEMPWYSLDDSGKYEQLVYKMLHMGENKNVGWIFVTDEVHELAPQGSTKTPVHLAAKRGLKRGLQNIVVTQDPATLSNSVTKQCNLFVWVGPMSPQDRTYLKERLKLDPSIVPDIGKYEYVVINRSGDVVTTGKTDPNYA